MKRWHEDFPITYREWKKHHDSHVQSNIDYTGNRVGKSPYEIDCVCDIQVGRLCHRSVITLRCRVWPRNS